MQFKEAVSKRILELCDKYHYSPNKLAEMSTIPPTTLRSMLANKVDNPSSYNIYKICKLFKMEMKDFFDTEYFKINKIDDD